MNGRAIGLAGAFFAGVRVAGQMTYIPAHIKGGKKINSRIIIPVYRNSHKGTNAKTGEKGRTDSFKLVAWGKLADVCARSLPRGKAIDAFCEPQSYLGNLFNADGSLRVDSAGAAIQTTKVSFTILNIVFGEESKKTVEEEKGDGRRPMNWDVPNHPDYQLWLSILQQRQAAVWNGQDATFGYARVVVPQGQGIQLDFSAAQPVQQPVAQPAPAAGMPSMVQHAVTTAPAPVAAGPTPAVNPNVTAPVQTVAAPAATGPALF